MHRDRDPLFVHGVGAMLSVFCCAVALGQEPATETPPPAEQPAVAAETPPAAPADGEADATTPAAGASPADELRLKFSFRRTRWIDVLEWLAAQSDLSLELDAPPPGSFNYVDPRQYSPIDAIDLVNGVLATKGYTLVRRERMLVVLNLKAGVPRALLPRVTLDDLGERGQFEMVSVAFPLEGRPMEGVKAEIEVLLGPYGQADPLPASGQILVSDRAGVMRAIAAVIGSIPKPKAPPKPPAPKEPEKPTLVVYELGGADPTATIETLKVLFGGIPFVHSAEGDQINAYATPSQHAAIEKIVAQMRGDAPAGRRPRLEVYPLVSLDEPTRQSFMNNLAMVAPAAQLRFDEEMERLFVWTKPTEHDAIRSAIVKLLQVTPQRGNRKLTVYALKRTDPTTLAALLKTSVPRARVTVDAPGRQLIVHATALDHQAIAQLVEQIDAELPADRQPVLRIYPVDRRMADRVSALATRFTPNAEVTIDAKLGRASVVATPDDHARIEPLLAKLTEAATELPKTTVEVVQVPTDLRDRFEALRPLLEAEVPDAKLMWSADSGELTVWATSDDHARVGVFMEQMSREPPAEPPKKTVEVYKVPKELRERFESIQTLLTAELPEAKLTWNPQRLELTVWATSKEHNRVLEVVEQVKKQPTAELPQATIEVHKLPTGLGDRFESIRTLFEAEVPDAKLFWDPETSELTVWAGEDDHALVRMLLEQISRAPPDEKKRHLVAYPIEMPDPTAAVAILQKVAEKAEITADPRGRRVLVWGTAQEHEAIQEAVDAIGRGDSPRGDRSFMSHPVKRLDLALAMRLLEQQFPGIEYEQDAARSALIALATAEEHKRIAAALREMQSAPEDAIARRTVVYPTDAASSEPVTRTLTQMLPGADVVGERNVPNVSVRGTDAEHELAKAVVDQWNKNRRDLDQPIGKVYDLKSVRASVLRPQLIQLVPGIYVSEGSTPDQIVARASAEQHELIAQLIEQIDLPAAPDDKVLAVYELTIANLTTLKGLLDERTATEIESVSGGADRVIVRATPPTHERLKAMIERIGPMIEPKPRLVIYGLEYAEPTTLSAMMQRAAPTSIISADTIERRLLVWATDDDHDLLSNLIKLIDTPSKDDTRIVAVYELPGGNLASVTGLLDSRTAAEIQSTPGTRNRVIVRATPENHEKLRAVINTIRPVIDPTLRIVIYDLNRADPEIIEPMIRKVAAQAEITPDPKRRRLLIRGTEEEHERIAEVIRELGGAEATKDERAFMPHPVKGLDLELVIRLLEKRIPGVTFEQDTGRSALIALATAEEHVRITEIIGEIEAVPQDKVPRRVVVYPSEPSSSAAIAQVLTDLLPKARVVSASNVPNVSVRGTDAEHVLAKTVVEQWNRNRREFDGRTAKVYELKSVSASQLRREMYRLVRDAYFAVGPSPDQLLARATEEEHELIARLLAQIDKPAEADSRVVEIYDFPGGDVAALTGLLDDRIADEIQTAPGGRDRIIVRATPEIHKEIRSVFDEVAPILAAKPRVVVYRLKRALPAEGGRLAQEIAPGAQIVVQPDSRSLAIAAVDEDHERLEAAIAELDRSAEAAPSELVSVVPITEAEPETLVQLLQAKYANEPDLNFSYDTATGSILVVGPADRHEEIKQIIAAADTGEREGVQKVVVYPLDRISGYIARTMISELMATERRPVTLSFEPYGNQLVAIASPRQHAMIRDALAQLRPKETEFEAFTLDVIDPETAQEAILGMFGGFAEGGRPPVVDADLDNYRLYVRGTPEQIAKVRELLTKMGEPQLDLPGGILSRSKVRFIPLGGDAEAALDAIRNVWPRLRKNELKLLEPESDRRFPSPQLPLPRSDTQPPEKTQLNGDAPPATDTGYRWPPFAPLSDSSLLFGQITKPRPVVAPPTKPRPVVAAIGDSPPQVDADTPPAEPQTGQPPPIYIVPGERGVTLMSEDEEALEQLERLLTVVARPQPRGGRRITVYAIRNADASRLAETLNSLYRRLPSAERQRRGRVVFVADERLNALVAFAGRGDQREIEELLEILDAKQSPDLEAMNRPVVIPLKFARASVVADQLKALYKTQLTAGGKQPVMEIPFGADPLVAAMMQQINAIRQGPLMTIDVDDETNSLLVVAPPPLLVEVRRFAEELDAAAEHPRRAVRIIPLKKTNAEEMDRALQRIMRQGRGRRRR